MAIIGAEIMGAGKFGPPGWHEDHCRGAQRSQSREPQ